MKHLRGSTRLARLWMFVVLMVTLCAPAARSSYAASGAWQGEYFKNNNFTNLAFTRDDPLIDFNWPINTGPFQNNTPTDTFSVRWTRTADLVSGTYKFVTAYDDVVHVYLDNTLVFTREKSLVPGNYGPESYEQDVPITAGTHTIKVEYAEKYGDATIRFNYAQLAPANVVRLESGGTNGYADSVNEYWTPDPKNQYAVYTTPITETEKDRVASQNVPIWNTLDDTLYQTQRYGDFGYAIPVPNGNYTVRMHFAENVFGAAGVRRFFVNLEGQKVIPDLDTYAVARKNAAITQSFNTTVADGVVNIDFGKIFDNPTIAAVDIYPANSGLDLAAPTFAPIPEAENASYNTPPTVTLSIADNTALKDGYWRLNDDKPTPLFTNLGSASFSQKFTIPQVDFDALALGTHTLSFGANDEFGNAWVQTWRFRKLNTSGSIPISFSTKEIMNQQTPGAEQFDNPTTIEYGPDGRLYIGQHDLFYFGGWQGGYIHALTLDKQHNVTKVDRISAIFNTPNVNPDGTPAIGGDGKPVQGRHLIGLDFDPASTPEKPILWVVHSDPRFCFNQPADSCQIDTNSGMITRLVGPDFDNPANRTDVISGLPRSRENHAPNAVHFGPDGWLYLTVGSDTNYGAPSQAFSQKPEDYLTAAVLRFNVKGAPARFPLDVRTLKSAAALEPYKGVFELFATGYRNAYDFLWHSNGNLYVNVNNGNFTAGTTPGPDQGCPNGEAFDPGTRADYLALVRQGDYGGHPNPARGECILADGSMYPSGPKTPLPNYRPPLLNYNNGTSTNGITEYRAPTFGGQMLHNIISATFYGNRSVRRVVLAPDGQSVQFEEDLAFFKGPLDVTTGPDGAIYVLEYGSENDNDINATPPKVFVMEPNPPVEGTWSVKKPMPEQIQEVGVTACEGKVYVLGGIISSAGGGSVNSTNAAWVYDPSVDSWRKLPDYPGAALNHVGAACVGGKVYTVGGLNSFAPVKSLLEYDPALDSWSQKADLPLLRGAMGVAVLNDEIYVAGGIGQEGGYSAKNTLLAYNPATNAWRQLASMQETRDHLIMEAVNGRLYAMGGRDVTIDSMKNANEIYDPVTDTWSRGAPMPIKRAAMASGTLHGQIQIWGGEGNPNSPTKTFDQGQMYDPKTNTWTTIANELTPRHGTHGATIGDVIYVPGGGPAAGTSVTDVNEAFTFTSENTNTSCIAPNADTSVTDTDNDGYKDQDEIDNGTNPCSPASKPPDNDGDLISDLNDPDDDNDGIPDTQDQFQLSPDNGLTTQLPWFQGWDPGSSAGYLKNTGFPGYQLTSKGQGFIPDRISIGGAGGYLGLNATGGTNTGGANSQDNALQVGFDATKTVQISSRIADPLNGLTLEAGKSGGIFFGLDQDNYVKLVLSADVDSPTVVPQTARTRYTPQHEPGEPGEGHTGVVLALELNGTYVELPHADLKLPGPATVDLFLTLDPATQRIFAQYRADSDDPTTIQTVGVIKAADYPGIAAFFKNGAATGVLTTRGGAGSIFGLAYDFFKIEEVTALPPEPPEPSEPPVNVPVVNVPVDSARKIYLPLVNR